MASLAFHMQRKGRFIVNFETTLNQCGKERQRIYSYNCEIEVGDDLDSHGFIIDNHEIDAYFKRQYAEPQPARSCERIAAIAATDIAGMLQQRGREVRRVRVTIYGAPAAGLTAEWRDDPPARFHPSEVTLY